MLSLYLLRHGETEFSRQDRFCGHIDAPLTAVGHVMAQQTAEALGHYPWRSIVTSTRARAVATAAPLAARAALPLRRDGRLDEMFYGDWQGLSKVEAASRNPEHFARWQHDPTIGAPGGESPLEACARAGSLIDELRTRYLDGNVLVVSHKAVLRLLLCRLLGIELRHYRHVTDWPAAALTIVDLGPDGAIARAIADVGHLGSAPEARRDFVREQHAGFGEPNAIVLDG